jgi:hypothetical protein
MRGGPRRQHDANPTNLAIKQIGAEIISQEKMDAFLTENPHIVELDPFEHKARAFVRLMLTTTVADAVGFSAGLAWLKKLPTSLPCRLSLWVEG